MYKYYFIFFCLLIQLFSISCASSSVSYTVNYPSLKNIPNIKKITVIPLEWNNETYKYSYLAEDINNVLISGVRKNNNYQFVDPSILKNISIDDYYKHVDIYVVGEITDVYKKEKGIKTKRNDRSYVKSVSVYINYKYIYAKDNNILRDINKTTSYENNSDDDALLLVLDVVYFQDETAEKIAKSSVYKLPLKMEDDLAAYKVRKEKHMIKSINKNPLFTEAERLVSKKKYSEAYAIYIDIYKNSNSAAAAYNASLLLIADKKYKDALNLLNELSLKLNEKGTETPLFILEEIETLNLIINNINMLVM